MSHATDKNATEKAIVAALEPLVDDVLALEKRLAELQGEIAKLRAELDALKARPKIAA